MQCLKSSPCSEIYNSGVSSRFGDYLSDFRPISSSIIFFCGVSSNSSIDSPSSVYQRNTPIFFFSFISAIRELSLLFSRQMKDFCFPSLFLITAEPLSSVLPRCCFFAVLSDQRSSANPWWSFGDIFGSPVSEILLATFLVYELSNSYRIRSLIFAILA